MARDNNYLIQAGQAKKRFLTYDQEKLIAKFRLKFDTDYLYVNLLCKQYRIDRKTGDMEYRCGGSWLDGNSFEEVMTVLDLLCDSRDDRWISHRWKNMQSFGLQFHQNLLEEQRDPMAEYIDSHPERLHGACLALGGEALKGADISYAIEVFDGLRMAVQFWHGDEEFAPRLRYLWDENAGQYIRYETMYFAVNLLLRRLRENMGE
ncbi:MAG: DUF3786 domain-containing protein [Oscillospiraceae bacterium]|nr:DUF3786 domain-containing protein [Oscillospiraceae bacterium]